MTKRKKPEDLLKRGRHTDYTPELAERICNLVATNPICLKKICEQNPGLPHDDTIYTWLCKLPEFAERYFEAKELQALVVTDKLWEEADNILPISEDINRFTARFRFQQWHLAKLAPKRFSNDKKNDTTVNVNLHEEQLKKLK